MDVSKHGQEDGNRSEGSLQGTLQLFSVILLPRIVLPHMHWVSKEQRGILALSVEG